MKAIQLILCFVLLELIANQSFAITRNYTPCEECPNISNDPNGTPYRWEIGYDHTAAYIKDSYIDQDFYPGKEYKISVRWYQYAVCGQVHGNCIGQLNPPPDPPYECPHYGLGGLEGKNRCVYVDWEIYKNGSPLLIDYEHNDTLFTGAISYLKYKFDSPGVYTFKAKHSGWNICENQNGVPFNNYCSNMPNGNDLVHTFTLTLISSSPTANPNVVVINKNSTGNSIQLTGSDPENENLTFAWNTMPSNGSGTLNTNNGLITNYTPNSGFEGLDSFTFTVTDTSNNTSLPAKVHLFVVDEPTVAPETVYHPVSRKKNGDPAHRWFPIGWAVDVHSLGIQSIEPVSVVDWEFKENGSFQQPRKGTVEFLKDDGNWWVNCLFPNAYPNVQAWFNFDPQHPETRRPQFGIDSNGNQVQSPHMVMWTQTWYWIEFLDRLEQIKNETSGQYDYSAFVLMTFRRSRIEFEYHDNSPLPTPKWAQPDYDTAWTDPLFDIVSNGNWKGSADFTVDPNTVVVDNSPTPQPVPITTPIPDLDFANSPNFGDLEIFAHRVKTLQNEPQLAGWWLSDEPYGGDEARLAGAHLSTFHGGFDQYDVREKIHHKLFRYKRMIELNDGNNANHPIITGMRGNGNVNASDFFEHVYDLGEIAFDNMYLGDYVHQYTSEWLSLSVSRTKQSIDAYINNIYNKPGNSMNYHSWMLWSQGYPWAESQTNPEVPQGTIVLDENGNPVLDNNGNQIIIPQNDKYMTQEQLRYVNYAPWINGANGALFWHLTNSDNIAYNVAKQISFEAHEASKYLLELPLEDNPVNFPTFINSIQSNADIQYTIREDPNFVQDSQHSKRLMIMICNNNKSQSRDIDIALPADHQIGLVHPLVQSYSWGHSIDGSVLSLNLSPLTARAFIVYIKN